MFVENVVCCTSDSKIATHLLITHYKAYVVLKTPILLAIINDDPFGYIAALQT